MNGTNWAIVILFFVIFDVCLTRQTADKAAGRNTKQVLEYIARVPTQGKILSGQFAGFSPNTFNMNQKNQIWARTGEIPAILGCDYACGWNHHTPPQDIIDYSCNPSLKYHWRKGGLVTVTMHLPNPASPDGGDLSDRTNLNFADLIEPKTETGKRWRLFLDRIAEGLYDLQRSGIAVLYRPFHEMNGEWFYWGDQDPELFKNVWRDVFNYFTNTKKLHNLLWVYSPDQSRPNPSKYYPGDSYVDIVALDAYTDDPDSMEGYNEMVKLNKPFALGEVGPTTTDGQFDYSEWIIAIQSKFPRTAYLLASNGNWSPIENKNAKGFYKNKAIINREKVKWRHTILDKHSSS